jgi:hypothetical protein
LLLGIEIMRSGAVAAWHDLQPGSAAKIWSDHPAVEISLGLEEIATASRNGRTVPAVALQMIADAATKAPLAPEPFLVRGVQLAIAKKPAEAQRAFEAAEWRDPRSLAAHYFLADSYLRGGDILRGLNQLAGLARLTPDGANKIAPLIAKYSSDPQNWPALRLLFRSNQALEDPVLTALASDPGNVRPIEALADARHRTPTSPWLQPLLAGLIADGRYDMARQVWADASHVQLRQGDGLYDGNFADRTSPPPFNWALHSSALGIAERQSPSALHVIFYGEGDGLLANQLLTLAPGTYLVSMQVSADQQSSASLHWSILCLGPTKLLSSTDLRSAWSTGWRFTVPANCPAQSLQLMGHGSDIPRQSEAVISSMKLTHA